VPAREVMDGIIGHFSRFHYSFTYYQN